MGTDRVIPNEPNSDHPDRAERTQFSIKTTVQAPSEPNPGAVPVRRAKPTLPEPEAKSRRTNFSDRHGFWGGGDRYPASEAEIRRFCNQSSW
jgi:hypothetical protein